MLGQYRITEIHKLFILNNFKTISEGIKQGNGALSGTRTHATGFGDLYSIQLSYERASTSYQKKSQGKASI